MPKEITIDGVTYIPKPPGRGLGSASHRPTLAGLIARCRRLNNYTLDELSEQSSVSKTYLWQLENGQSQDPSLRVAVRIAVALGIDVNMMAETLD